MSDLDDTDDDRVPVVPAPLRRPSSGQFSRPTMSDLEAADIANSKWGKDKDEAMLRLEAALAKVLSRLEAHDRRWRTTRKVLTAVATAALTSAGLAFKLAFSSGAASHAADASRAEQHRIRETVERLDRAAAADHARMEAMFDTLRLRYPIGSIPLQGPPNDPGVDQ